MVVTYFYGISLITGITFCMRLIIVIIGFIFGIISPRDGAKLCLFRARQQKNVGKDPPQPGQT